MSAVASWPVKIRDLHNHHFDSTVWDGFAFRPDDIVIGTYAKSGTTWVQQIVGQLVFGGAETVPVAELSPWLDLRVPPREVKLAALEAQTHRRFLKTHLPVDALAYSPMAKYLYIGRDGRDVVWSLHHHHATANALWYELINDTPGRVGPPIAPPPASRVDYFQDWLEQDGHPFWPFFENVRSWWAIRELPNLLLLHYAELKADLPGQIRRIAAFLDIPLDDATLAKIAEHASFGWMKAHAEQAAPLGGAIFEGGAATFINRGTNGRWQGELPEALSRRHEEIATERLGRDCAAWLEGGGAKAAAPSTVPGTLNSR